MTEGGKQSVAAETMVVIFAAGQGKRMGRADMAKVCFEIDGVPAINRLIETFKRRRFQRFMVVAGSLAEQVMEIVSRSHPETIFVHQSPQLGTGHAARIAAEALANIGHAGPVLVCLGDKYLETAAVDALVDGFIRQQADLAFLTVPRTKATAASSGRVLTDASGQAVAIVEAPDLARQAIADDLRARLVQGAVTAEQITKTVEAHIATEKKRAAAVPDLLRLASAGGPVAKDALRKVLAQPAYQLTIDGRAYTAAEIERICKEFNPSLYLFAAEAFQQGVRMLDNDNAQQEYYLPDVVFHLGGLLDDDGARRFRVRTVFVSDPNVIQGFNSPDELLAIQDYLRRRKPGDADARIASCQLPRRQYATAAEWLAKLEKNSPSLRRWLQDIYGRHEELHAHKVKTLTKLLKCYARRFSPDDKVVIVRAPGRINLMGRHVDHRGAFNNFLAIHRETLAVAGLREDDRVLAVNAEPKQFADVEFSIGELIGRFAWSDWVNFVNSDWVRQLLRSSAGDWGNYIKAAMLRLQHQYTDLRIHGMNLALTGDVPIAAGLSSSSTIVVATLQAAIALSNLELTSRQFIDLCGEGEWFVGSRGGAGDHAAIYLGQRGKIAQVGYLPFRVEAVIDSPADHQVVIANSHIKAAKSSSAKDAFNARIAAYNLGLALLKQRCPEIAPMIEHVRDLTPDRLGCRPSQLYRYLLRLPERMTRKEVRAALPGEFAEFIDANFAPHSDPGHYDMRGVLIFGAAETLRSRMCSTLLTAGRIAEFGRLMSISHDGDRVARADESGSYRPAPADYSDDRLNALINDLAGEDPQRVLDAQLYRQPGGYACSTPEIDEMVDIAAGIPGVAGAQIAGAGLGGCIMVLAHRDAVPALHRALAQRYYRPRGLKPGIIDCITVEGAGLADF